MTRQPIVAGNWKMNATLEQAAALSRALLAGLKDHPEVEVVLCPPFTALARVGEILKGSRISLGAQNLYFEPKGAYTGEISGVMLKDLGCSACIIGHSERRQLFGETDDLVHRKIAAAFSQGIRAILCVGESLEERRNQKTWARVENQLKAALEGVASEKIEARLVIAYEPVWAIGTGQNATPAQAQEVHSAIRKWLSTRFGKPVSESVRIQYGGSVKAENAAELMAQADVDGALVGGASLDSKVFISIVQSTIQAKKGSPCSTGSS